VTINNEKNDYISTDPESADLPQKVFESEINAILSRRKTYQLPEFEFERNEVEPDVKLGLVGLSLSGGGIRSSTFNLGVLQALEDASLFKHIDYLSTVSGGGYIGSCLSSYWAGNSSFSYNEVDIIGVPRGCCLSQGNDLGDGCWRLKNISGTEVVLSFPSLDVGREFDDIIRAVGVPVVDNGEAEPLPLFLKTPVTENRSFCMQTVTVEGLPCVALSGQNLSANLNVVLQLGGADDFPFCHKSGQLETQSFRHLRECADYLKPPSPFASLRLPGIFLRGLLVNALIVLPLLLLTAVVTVLVSGNDIHDALNTTKIEYLIDNDTLQENRTTEEINRGDYQDIDINLQSMLAWSPHDKKLDILFSKAPKGMTFFAEDREGNSESICQLGNDFYLLKGQSLANLGLFLDLPDQKAPELPVTAWESDNHFQWLNSNWGYRIRSHFLRIFDAWQTTIPLDANTSKKQITNEPGKNIKSQKYSLDLADYIGWQNYILISNVPKNSFSKEGRFLGEGHWLFDGDAASDLKLSFSIPDLGRDFHPKIKAWQSVHIDQKIKAIQQPVFTAEVRVGRSSLYVYRNMEGAEQSKQENLKVLKRHSGIDVLDELKDLSGINFSKDNGELYVRFSQLHEIEFKEQLPKIRRLSQKRNEWVFMEGELEVLKAHLQKLLTKEYAKNTLFKITMWKSYKDAQVYDPVSQLYRNTFNITKWILLFFVALLALCPIIQKIIKNRGVRAWSLRDLLTRYICGASIAVILGSAFIEAQPLFIYLFHRIKEVLTLTAIVGGADKGLALIGSLIAAGGGLLAANSVSRGAKVSAKISLYAMGVVGPAVLWIFYLNFCLCALANENIPEMFKHEEAYVLWIYLEVALVTYFLTNQFYNVNRTSLHPFYRDRLSKTFLISKDAKTGGLYHNDEQKLHSLNTSFSPYHIINTTLNIVGKSNINLKGRKADFFSFSRDYIGSRITGYVRTKKYEETDDHMGLGTAMAISGAAAAPNMGRETSRPLTFIMALLNIRLSYWAKNPMIFGPMKKKGFWSSISNIICPNQVGPFFLLKEMVGLVNEKSSFVNLSDGGHLENMGLYELVRRRCKYIIVCDAEADKEMTCHGLSDAIRMILIDMGIKIHIDLRSIYRKSKNSDGSIKITGDKHFAIGTIEYGPGHGQQGYLLYIKSSVSGNHSAYIEDYLARHPDFPHETTADQFFDEAQFEAYRALGCEIGDDILRCIKSTPETPQEDSESNRNKKLRWAKEAELQWRELLRTAEIAIKST
jgi:hypothetical protein